MAAMAGTRLYLHGGAPVAAVEIRSAPRLFPDYNGVTIPPNIAPLNFRIQEPARRYRVELHSSAGAPIIVSSRSTDIRLPLKAWRALLKANAGHPLYWEITVEDDKGQWRRFATVTNFVAREEIDNHLVYRLLKPLYNVYKHVGIYQRDLESFQERPVLENDQFDGHCLNCHTFLNHQADTFAFHTRLSSAPHPMVLVRSNQPVRVDKTMGYMSWHPSGRLLAFSINKPSMLRHTVGETREVYDSPSDIGIYRVDSNTVVVPSAISRPDRDETWPEWAPDGSYLYYCGGPPMPIQRFHQIRYDLMRVSYDLEHDQWGEPEVLLSAKDAGLSACQPKVSPDGKLLLFVLCKWGNFPIYHPESDLWIMELQTRRCRRLDINSDQADSWHCWSANGRWIVFSSKRLDGLFARPFFSYVDEQGEFHKPFLLPQADVAFYDTFLKTFNVPQLVQGEITVREADLAQTILKPNRALKPTTVAPGPAPSVTQVPRAQPSPTAPLSGAQQGPP